MRARLGSAFAPVAAALALALIPAAALTPAGCKQAPAAPDASSTSGAATIPASPTVAVLDAAHAPLRGRFDEDADALRILVLASPT